MFYSQLLLSKKGALGTVWVAAHCYQKLKKDQVQQTNISSSVDKILIEEVPVVAHRILAYLLLGVVRIFSKKVDYLFHDCHDVLNKISKINIVKRELAGRGASHTHDKSVRFPPKKSKPSRVAQTHDNSISFPKRSELSGVSETRESSITLPERFELDMFDLGPLQDRDREEENIRSREELMLADERREEGSRPSFLFMMNTFFPKDGSTEYTPPRDVFSPHFMEKDRVTSSYHNTNNFTTSPEVYRRETHFSLEDRMEPMILDEAEEKEEEEMRNKSSNNEHPVNFQEQNENNMNCESVASESHNGIESVLVNSAVFDKAKENINNKQTSNEEVMMSFGEEHVIKETHSFQEDEPQNITGSVDKEQQAVSAKKTTFEETSTPEESRKRKKTKEERPVTLTVNVTPEPKLVDFAAVQTPALRERAKVLKKRRKTLFDFTTVVPNCVYKDWINDPEDLICKERTVPHSRLQVWRAHKLLHIPSFTEPLIPCISIDLHSLEEKMSISAMSFKQSANQDEVRSPVVTHEDEELIPNVKSPVAHDDREQASDIGSPVIQRSREQTPIAPGTPVTNLNSLRSHENGAVAADSDIFLEPTSSNETIDKVSSPFKGGLELDDDVFLKETNSSEGESVEKNIYSARTRMTESYLHNKFLYKKRRNEEQVLSVFQLLAEKTKKESARLFYEILVLKTRDFIDVHQENAYGDILLKLKSGSET